MDIFVFRLLFNVAPREQLHLSKLNITCNLGVYIMISQVRFVILDI